MSAFPTTIRVCSFPGEYGPSDETFAQGLARLASWPSDKRPDLRYWQLAVSKGWTAYYNQGPRKGQAATPQEWYAADISFEKQGMTLWMTSVGWRVCLNLASGVVGHHTIGWDLLPGFDFTYAPALVAHFEQLWAQKTDLQRVYDATNWDEPSERELGLQASRAMSTIWEELLGRGPSTFDPA